MEEDQEKFLEDAKKVGSKRIFMKRVIDQVSNPMRTSSWFSFI